MTLLELARSAGAEIGAYKTRSALTALSLAVGVAAILFTLCQTRGMSNRSTKGLELMGSGRLKIEKKRGFKGKGLSPGLTSDDAALMRRHWPELYMAYPMVRRWQTRIRLEDFKSDDLVTWGTTEEWARRDWVYAVRGRFLTADDVREARRVAVILQPGGWVQKPYWAKYFPEQALEKFVKRREVLGKEVLLDDHVFTVVGILQEPPRDKDPRWGHSSYGGSGNVIVPITAYQKYLLPRWNKGRPEAIDEIQVDTGGGRDHAALVRAVKGLLDARHRGEKDYNLKDFNDLWAGRIKRQRERALAVLVIGVVAVLASGIGIMNVTLATIFSRIREIGIRRALGATRADIINQFVSEAVVLGAVGGVGGTALGWLFTIKLAPDPDMMAPVTASAVGLAMLIALATGFFFSLYPAWQASRLDPVESLRYE